ncbi:MAG: S46 family peptidase [Bacteroidales bacterium]|nr:S46 family peptidase [Bacteroidales bacterium]
MKKIFVFLFVFITCGALRADEGMWLLPLLEKMNIGTMRQMGCELTADQIYSVNHSSLKDAVVIFGGGCTGELISGEGLLITNHHCGYDAIQQHSSLDHNYLADGFWAKSRDEELHTPDLKATFLVRIEDVTQRVDSVLNDTLTEPARKEAIGNIRNRIVGEAVKGTHYNASVKSFFGGNRFYLLVYEEFKDIRMVGAPPSSIGKFGADADNWMWPRHTGDFSIFRIYADAEGKPAEYSPDNVPLKPKYFLPISLKGVEKDDFTMILGYPGGTDRYSTSFEVRELLETELSGRIMIRGEKQEIMMRHMEADEEIRIKYASKYSRSSNYWKYSIGQAQGVKRLNVHKRKAEQEQRFTQWLDDHPERKAKYGDALSLIREGTERNKAYAKVNLYMLECFFQGVELFRFSLQFQALMSELEKKKPDREQISTLAALLKESADDFYKDYDQALDREVTEAMFRRYFNDIDPAFHPAFYATVTKKYKGDIHRYTQDWFKSVFADPGRLYAFLQKPTAKTLAKDPVFQASIATRALYLHRLEDMEQNEQMRDKGARLYIAGMLEMDRDKKWYPDANFSMRLTYGSVQDYFPRDAVFYNYYTTLQGVMEKEDPSDWEFVVPERLKELFVQKDFGPYANRYGELPVCFISDNDITGGNSGSPVINGKGQLAGLAFDGNWEAMSGDITFEPDLQRTISVDIRYVLFIIDKYAGAGHLLNEMHIVR